MVQPEAKKTHPSYFTQRRKVHTKAQRKTQAFLALFFAPLRNLCAFA